MRKAGRAKLGDDSVIVTKGAAMSAPMDMPQRGTETVSGATTRLSIDVTKDLLTQLRAAAVRQDTTVRAIVLRALKAAGYDIGDDELNDKRKTVG